MKPLDTLPTFLYAGIVVMSLGAGGATIEFCTISADGCGSRRVAFIVFSILTSFLSCFPLVLLVDKGLLSAFPVQNIEIFFTPVVVLCSLIAAAISTSPRTPVSELYALLAWFSFISSNAALLLALNKSTLYEPKADDYDSVKTPFTEVVSETTNAASLQPPEPTLPIPPAPSADVAPRAPAGL